MNKTAVAQLTPMAGLSDGHASSGGTIRRQLIWASLFPLAFFGLLSMLVIASALYETTLALVTQRNSAQAQAMANELAWATTLGHPTSETLQQIGADASTAQILFVDQAGAIISQAGPALIDNSIVQADTAKFAVQNAPHSLLTTSSVSGDQIILSYSAVPGTDHALLMVEPWSLIMTPAYYYQLMLVALLLLGTILSLVMLSASVGRIIGPISELSRTASQAVPGSTFHPVPERGPIELRSLTASFNQMVIQLAEQQTTLRQYAQKALLSQEEERQRLSHELHDGTVQDLVGLAQRLELCSSEMERDPVQARRRLDELRTLAKHTLDEVRNISNALRPPILQDLGLSAALQVLCNDLEGQLPHVHCTCQLSGIQRRLPPEMELAVFRVAQEALSNVRKHAQDAKHVSVSLEICEDSLLLEVKDDGLGSGQPDLGTLVRNGHLGYAGMYERARLFNGTLEVDSAPGSGTTVKMDLPL